MSDIKKTMQEECYGTCWAACERIEELETQLISATNRIKRLEKDLSDAYAEMRKQRPGITAVFDHSVWTKAMGTKP